MSGWMGWLFKILQPGTDAQPLAPMDKLKETLKKLEEKSGAYKKKAAQEVKKKENFERAGDSEAASRCLELETQYEQLIKKLETFQFHIKRLMITLEGVKATAETAEVLKIGAAELQKLHRALNIDDENELMKDINGLIASLGQIQDSFSTTSGAAADSNEAEMEIRSF